MNEIIRILMTRDGYTKEEAKEIYEEVMEEVYDAISTGDYSLAEDIFESDLGLEPDYLLNVLIDTPIF